MVRWAATPPRSHGIAAPPPTPGRLPRPGHEAFPFRQAGRGGFSTAVYQEKSTTDEVNPLLFAKPLAPLVAAQRHRRSSRLPGVLRRIGGFAGRCECALIEGTGSVLVPLGEGLSVLDLFPNQDCHVIQISGNRLGTPDRAIPTDGALKHAGIKKLKVVLRPSAERDSPADSDGLILSEMPAPTPLIPTPSRGKIQRGWRP